INLRNMTLIQIAVGAAISGIGAWIWGYRLGASIAIGSGLLLFNMCVLAWYWGRLTAQKTIAWTLVGIVIKYTVLLGSLYYLTRTEWFVPLGAGAGIASFMVTALIMAALHQYRETRKDSV